MEAMAHFPVDPKKWGTGVWFSLHVTGFDVKSINDIPYFIKTLKLICNNLPCSKCKEHASTFLREHPPESYINKNPDKCFEFTVDLHNHVNSMNGSGHMSYDEARDIYKNYNAQPVSNTIRFNSVGSASSESTTPESTSSESTACKGTNCLEEVTTDLDRKDLLILKKGGHKRIIDMNTLISTPSNLIPSNGPSNGKTGRYKMRFTEKRF